VICLPQHRLHDSGRSSTFTATPFPSKGRDLSHLSQRKLDVIARQSTYRTEALDATENST
jgi:hypothetical protein